MRCLLFPMGSYGDVHPYIGLGLELQRRGHDVAIVTSIHFQPLVERVGLEFHAIDTQPEYESVIRNPDLFHHRRGFRTIARLIMIPWQQRQLRWIEQLQVPGETVIVGPCMAPVLDIARQTWDIPWVSIHLQPMVMWSEIAPPVLMRGQPLGPVMPRWWNGFWYGLMNELVVDRVLRKPVNELHRAWQLPPVRATNQLWHSPDKVLGLFPEWFAPPQADWPQQTVLTGFPLWDESHDTALPAEAAEFLDDGDPPVAFTPGSAMTNARRFFSVAAEACRKSGKRGLLLTRFPQQLPKRLPPGVRHLEYAPFSQLLPRCAALVYHGGIGTLSQACAAGVPHLIMPMSHDQPDNAARIQQLGIGRAIFPERFTTVGVAAKLKQITSCRVTAQNCQRVRENGIGQGQGQGIAQAVNEIEETFRNTKGRHRIGTMPTPAERFTA